MSKAQIRRPLHINGELWKWKCTGSKLLILPPDGKKKVFDLTDVTGWSWDDLERGEWKGYFALRPSDVKRFIENGFSQPEPIKSWWSEENNTGEPDGASLENGLTQKRPSRIMIDDKIWLWMYGDDSVRIADIRGRGDLDIKKFSLKEVIGSSLEELQASGSTFTNLDVKEFIMNGLVIYDESKES